MVIEGAGRIMKELTVEGRPVGDGHPVFVIAEAGINHGGDLEVALRMVEEAAESGADAIKFQTYITEKRVPADNPLFGLLESCELDEKSHQELQGLCGDKGITFLSTAFDEESVERLANLNVSVIKVASFDIVNLDLLNTIAETRIPVILSTGMADGGEVETGVGIFERSGSPYALLHCISAYPAEEKDVNLGAMITLRERFGCPVGFSDHTLGIRASIYSVLAGANIVEKHFTLDRNLDGPDHILSVDPAGLQSLMAGIREAEAMLGSREIVLHSAEKGMVPYRRISG